MTDFEKQILVLIGLQILFEGRYKIQDRFRYFLHLFSVPSFIFSKNERGLILAYPQRIVLIMIIFIQRMVKVMVIGHSIQYKMDLVSLHVYRSIKSYSLSKLFKNSDADLSWLLF